MFLRNGSAQGCVMPRHLRGLTMRADKRSRGFLVKLRVRRFTVWRYLPICMCDSLAKSRSCLLGRSNHMPHSVLLRMKCEQLCMTMSLCFDWEATYQLLPPPTISAKSSEAQCGFGHSSLSGTSMARITTILIDIPDTSPLRSEIVMGFSALNNPKDPAMTSSIQAPSLNLTLSSQLSASTLHSAGKGKIRDSASSTLTGG